MDEVDQTQLSSWLLFIGCQVILMDRTYALVLCKWLDSFVLLNNNLFSIGLELYYSYIFIIPLKWVKATLDLAILEFF